jgi:hypothetical protein
MIQATTKPMARSLLITPSFVVPSSRDSSSVDSATTTVTCSKKSALHHQTPAGEGRRPCSKKVEFNRSVTVKPIPSLARFSKKERSNIWYSAEEYMDIRQSAITTVMKMAKREAVDLDPNDSSRGLEGRTPQEDALRHERRQIIAWSVLTEQEEHDQDDYETRSQAISAAYSMCNRSCSYEAETRGELDAMEAWGIAEAHF